MALNSFIGCVVIDLAVAVICTCTIHVLVL